MLEGLRERYEWLHERGLIEIGVNFVPAPEEKELREEIQRMMEWMVIEVPQSLREGVSQTEKSLLGWESGSNYLRGVKRDSLHRGSGEDLTLKVPANQIEVAVIKECDVFGQPDLVDLLVTPTPAGWLRVNALWTETREIESRLADAKESAYWAGYVAELDERIAYAERLRSRAHKLVRAFEYSETESTGEFEARFVRESE